MANLSLRLLALLAAPAVLAAAQNTTTKGFITNGPLSPNPTDLESVPTLGPTLPGRNATFFSVTRTMSRPPFANTSRPIDRPTLTRPDPGATITTWTTEIVTITSCPCASIRNYGYDHEAKERCTSSRTLTVTLTSMIKDCHHGYGGCKDAPDYPEPTQEPPHYGESDEEEEDCNEGREYGSNEGLGECYGRERGCEKYEDSQDDAGDRYEDNEDGYGEYDELRPKQGHRKEKDGHHHKEENAYGELDSKQKDDHEFYKDKDITYDHEHKDGYEYQEKEVSYTHKEKGAHNRKERSGYDRPEGGVYVHIGNEKGAHNQKGKNKDGEYGMQELDGNGKHEPSKDKVVPKPPRKRFELTIARHKLEKRQHGHKPPECTKKGGPKPTDDQKHEPTGGPTGPGQCHGGCSGPDSTSTLTAMVMITITPSVTKIVTPITRRLPVSSAPITPVSTTTSAQTEMGGATSSFPTGSSTTSSMPTFIAGAARLGREVQVTGRWGMLVACMWVGMVAVGFGMGGVGF